MSEDIQVWGIRAYWTGQWLSVGDKQPFFTFSRQKAEAELKEILNKRGNQGLKIMVEIMDDETIAEIPEAVSAIIALYQIRTARIAYQQAQGWKKPE
jgi:hypothetical protein